MSSEAEPVSLRARLTALRQEWPRFLLEVVVLVLGISVSFVLEERRQEQQERRAERQLWRAAYDNLAADSLFLTRRIGQLEMMLRSYERLLAGRTDSIDVDMDRLVSYVAFRPTDHAFEEIRQGSGSRLRNRALVARLASLYARDYDLVREWDGIARDFVLSRMYPYLDLEGPYVASGVHDGAATGYAPVYRALSGRDDFRNLVRTHLSFKQAQITVYRRALDGARELMTRIRPTLDATATPPPR
ncbi:MAG TPA: hypothetical protein VEA99_10850 [Gemmatimonadaceae bacterium]|nr:hypothetical protein [Gemmatimonadaceae bacterium]